jgi:hypothetical protein
MRWGIRRAAGAIGTAARKLGERVRTNAAKRASHPDRRLLETAQRNGKTYMTYRQKANIAKRQADEVDIRIARKHKMIVDNGKAVRKMSNDEISAILKSPKLQKSLSDLNDKQMKNARTTAAVVLGLYGALIVGARIAGGNR